MKKKIFVVIVTIILSMTACASKKQEDNLSAIAGTTAIMTETEIAEKPLGENSEAEAVTESVDTNYDGGYEFPEEATVGFCLDCDEDAEEFDTLIATSDMDANEYKYMGCSFHDMIINGHSFEDVKIISTILDREQMKEWDEYTIGEYEDDAVYIKLLKITDKGQYYGYLYDKTHPIKRTDGNVEYPEIYTYCPAKPVTFGDMITALHAFYFEVISGDESDHLHISPVIK